VDAPSATRPDIKELRVPPTVPQDGACTRPAGCVPADWSGIRTPGPARDPTYLFLGITYAGHRPRARPASTAAIGSSGNRRYLSPRLVDSATGRGVQINAGSDPNWNAAADPGRLADSTAVVHTENVAFGANPTPHRRADSTEPGFRNSRVIIAHFPEHTSAAAEADRYMHLAREGPGPRDRSDRLQQCRHPE
jgi:hypothetical protein